ncbi:MAG: DUF1579 domain-containing protein [Phycisphaerae bacterium]
MQRNTTLAVLTVATLAGAIAWATTFQAGFDPQQALAAQREAMKSFEKMDGVWRGEAWTLLPNGEKHEMTQTERVGPMLDGTIRVVEGLGYDKEGSVSFNAFAVISYDVQTKKYNFRSHAMGRLGDFEIIPNDDGFTWEIPAGPITIRYQATIKDGVWKEVGERIMPGQEPIRFVEFELKRVCDTDWPRAGAVPAK